MIFTQHYLACLSHASYVIGDETTGRAVVVDPRRDIDDYLGEAAEHSLRIERVIETHIHAEFLSGHLELAAATGALISYGAGADVEFPIETLLDAQRISLGEVTLEILATPGHTPESICIVVYQHAGDEIPYGVLTGDTLFVGDVGRPDLCVASGVSADQLAQTLYRSLHGKTPEAARYHPCLSRPRRRIDLRQAAFERDQLDDRRAAADQLCAADDQCGPIRCDRDQGTAGAAALLPVRRAPQSRIATAAERKSAALIGYRRHMQARPSQGTVLLDSREPADYAYGHLRGAVNVGLGDVLPSGPAMSCHQTATLCWLAMLPWRRKAKSGCPAWATTESSVNCATSQRFSHCGQIW